MTTAAEPEFANLEWGELELAAERAFSDPPELQWAKRAWGALCDVGLARYSNELERTSAALRFFALCDFYLDFAHVGFGEQCTSLYLDWCEALDISPLRVGQLVGPARNLPEDENENTPMLVAVQELSRDQRPLVVETLKTAFGGINGLFVSLWKSRLPESRREPEDGPQCRWEEVDDEILNRATGEKLAVYSWLDQGGDSCRPGWHPLERHDPE